MGHDVIGIDDLNHSYDVSLKNWRIAQMEGTPRLNFHQVSIVNRTKLNALFEENAFEVVVNLAARAGVRQSLEDPWSYYETNVTGALNLLELCRVFKVRKFIQASTSSLYGDGALPFREDQPTDHPQSPYAASKKAAEALCYTYHHLHGLDVTVFRYFTVYGPAGRPDMSIFRFVAGIAEGRQIPVYGDGSQKRDYTYVDDVAQGTVLGLAPAGFEVVNLGSDRPVSVNDVIAYVEKLLGRRAVCRFLPRHPADVTATWADVNKAKRMLGWVPETPLEKGLENTVTWYQANRPWASKVETGG